MRASTLVQILDMLLGSNKPYTPIQFVAEQPELKTNLKSPRSNIICFSKRPMLRLVLDQFQREDRLLLNITKVIIKRKQTSYISKKVFE